MHSLLHNLLIGEIEMTDYNLVYLLDGKVYINLTNSCTNDCVFCIRSIKEDVVGANLFLNTENVKAEDVIAQLEAMKDKLSSEIIFCGYGEPFLKKDMMKAFAQYLRKNYPEIKIRVNTNGHANAIYKTNVAEEFKGLLDEASVSLNSDNSEQYNEICQPKIENAYEAVKDFLKCCKEAGIKTYASIVTGFDEREINIEKCEKIAKELGAEFRNREFITNGY